MMKRPSQVAFDRRLNILGWDGLIEGNAGEKGTVDAILVDSPKRGLTRKETRRTH